MKNIRAVIIICTILAGNSSYAGYYSRLWQATDTTQLPVGITRVLQPAQYRLYALNSAAMQSFLYALPAAPEAAQTLQLPAPDGSIRGFRVWQTPVMEEGLAAKYPEIKTFTGTALQDPAVTVKLDYTPYGFHALVYDDGNTYFIDPYSNENTGYYQVYYKQDYARPGMQRMHCEADGDSDPAFLSDDEDIHPQYRINGSLKRTYRLALACTGEYAVAVAGSSPAKGAVLARMAVSVNRVNGVYERELAITLQLVANTDTLIFLDGSTDPYDNSNGSLMMSQNQTVADSRIGVAGYDIGHVFSTGGGGIAQKGSVCNSSLKARGVTGAASPQGDAFDIDYVAHEMGHQLGADHTFNSNMGSCGGGNRVASCAYEPGSGSTIMAYAGLCGSDNLQGQGSAYFHARSLEQITAYLATGGACAAVTPTGNTPVSLPAFSHSYNIPFRTPFELTAPESAAGTPTWCWEEWDLSNSEATWSQSRLTAPLFRSFTPDTSRTRVFPQLEKLLGNITSYVGEKLPDTGRKLRFRLTVRSFRNGTGSFNFANDSIVLNVIRTAMPFAVVSPNTAAISWTGGTTQTVTWHVGGTDATPISCTRVDIYLSVDGGHTYPFLLRAQAPNTGSAGITVPNTHTTSNARIKVKGNGNVFFDISDENFTIIHDNNLPYPSAVTETQPWTKQVELYPVPAVRTLHVSTMPGLQLQVNMYNITGRELYKSTTYGDLAIPVAGWQPGVYYLRLADPVSGQRIVRPVMIQ